MPTPTFRRPCPVTGHEDLDDASGKLAVKAGVLVPLAQR
jgi:hypothetical protein